MSPWSVHFGWPAGDVYGNIIASGICAAAAALVAAPVVLRLRAAWRCHTEHQAARHAETHQLLRRLHEHLGIDMPEEDQE